jgi:hypothetical protein
MPQPASMKVALPNSEKRSALHSATPLMLEASNAQLACYAETTIFRSSAGRSRTRHTSSSAAHTSCSSPPSGSAPNCSS